jgi:uncharacterized membrane protein
MRLRFAIAFLLFLLGIWIYVLAYPYLFQLAIEYKLDSKKNVFIHTQSPSPLTPYTPNPDLIYSIAFYDLSKGDVELKGEIPVDLPYFSIAFYQSNTSHFAVLKKESFKDTTFNITLTQHKTLQSNKKGIEVFSPTKTGTLVIRYYCNNKKAASTIAAFQKNTQLFVNKQ